ncbi:hypothetical protein SUDANB58_02048 [Streptomyces sp. enrichment culture]
MNSPVFEEFDPVSDCDCPGCRHWRRVLPLSPHSPGGRAPGHPAARRALIAASTAATAGSGAPAARTGPAAAGPASHGVPGYPGRAMFRPGARNAYVTRLGEQLVRKGFGAHYTTGPGPRWGEADRRGVEAFQRAQGWRGGAADGCPGPETWRRLFS